MAVQRIHATATVGDVPYDVTEWELNGPPIDFVRSLYATLPDPRWTATDSHGHVHRWALTGRDERHQDEALPTLVVSSRHVPCDGSCDGSCGGVCDDEGYDVTVWHCHECGDEVKPGYVPDIQAQTTGVPVEVGPPTMSFTAVGEPPADWGCRVEVALTVGDHTRTGEGAITGWQQSSEGGATFDVEADLRD